MTPPSFKDMTTDTTVIVTATNPGQSLGRIFVCRHLQAAYRKMVALSKEGWQVLHLSVPLPVR